MRIGVSGSHGVGKTTLANKLRRVTRLPAIDEIARTVANEMGFEDNEQIRAADRETLKIFQQRIYYNQLLAERELSTFISDRTVFDVIAYKHLYGLDRGLIDEFTQHASRHSASYDLIFFCPIPTAEIAADGFRLTDPASQISIDFHLKTLLMNHAKCPVIFLPSDRGTWFKTAVHQIRGQHE